MLLIDLEAYCNSGILDSLKAILRRHIAGPPLWRDGNNQPPFTIAAAKHISFVDPSWNVRLGDARGQAQVSRLKRKRHQFVEDECTAMLADPWILHAHFKPCDALPNHLCRETLPSNSSSDLAKSKHTHDIAKNLKYVSFTVSWSLSHLRIAGSHACAQEVSPSGQISMFRVSVRTFSTKNRRLAIEAAIIDAIQDSIIAGAAATSLIRIKKTHEGREMTDAVATAKT